MNPAVRVPILKTRDKSARRAFTLSEIKRILKACGDGAEWRGLVLFGLYLGQRVGDLARLTWRAVNLESGEIAFTTRKTGRRIVLPLVQPLADYLASLPVRFLEVVSNYSQYFTRVCSVRSMRERCFLMEILPERHPIV